ncbi:MAG: mechanosensitive ion channel [Gammaproteobacteria bacterium]|nr:MAG: mechanosensitive ion channel [Gammaproteobacteria bacterium]
MARCGLNRRPRFRPAGDLREFHLRPDCRVGDIITIGGVEGTVMRIRTRATTIMDWDNREVIVPNKNFITERLVNWTLSDTTTRIVIKIGIAYRADARVALQLLLDTARANELVLADPAPNAWLTSFADNKQELELRVFVAEINQRNLVRTGLQVAIAETLRARGIEMAQMAPIPSNSAPNENQPAPSADASSASKRT